MEAIIYIKWKLFEHYILYKIIPLLFSTLSHDNSTGDTAGRKLDQRTGRLPDRHVEPEQVE